jgi:hypothetical protein
MTTEAPFYPREKIVQQQQYFQKLSKHTHLKGRYDVITSVAIPLALAGTSLFMIVSSKISTAVLFPLYFEIASFQPMTCLLICEQGRGIYNMSHGIGKKE